MASFPLLPRRDPGSAQLAADRLRALAEPPVVSQPLAAPGWTPTGGWPGSPLCNGAGPLRVNVARPDPAGSGAGSGPAVLEAADPGPADPDTAGREAAGPDPADPDTELWHELWACVLTPADLWPAADADLAQPGRVSEPPAPAPDAPRSAVAAVSWRLDDAPVGGWTPAAGSAGNASGSRSTGHAGVGPTVAPSGRGPAAADQQAHATVQLADGPPVRPQPSVAELVRAVAGRHVPETLRGAVVGLGRGPVLALAAVVAVAVVVGAALLLRARPAPVVVPEPSRAGSPRAASAASSRPSSPAAQVVVDVAGAVGRPGLVTLPAGSRVADALSAAGGARPGTDLRSVNLARRLVDGEQLLVGVPGLAPGVSSGSAQSPGGGGVAGQPLDLNAASEKDLESLDGVGPVLAQRIVGWRTAHGRFDRVDQLREVSGLGEKKLDAIKAQVHV